MRSEMSSKTGSRYFKKPLDRARHQLSAYLIPRFQPGKNFQLIRIPISFQISVLH